MKKKQIKIKNRKNEHIVDLIVFQNQRYDFVIKKPGDYKLLEFLLKKYFHEGIKEMGEIIYEKPIMPQDRDFLDSLAIKLGQVGYLLEIVD